MYVGNELAAVATPILVNDEPLYFLTIQSDQVGDLRFEMNGETYVPENGNINYSADAHSGSLKAPVLLRSANDERPYKLLEDNHVVIIRGGEKYSLTGTKLQ